MSFQQWLQSSLHVVDLGARCSFFNQIRYSLNQSLLAPFVLLELSHQLLVVNHSPSVTLNQVMLFLEHRLLSLIKSNSLIVTQLKSAHQSLCSLPILFVVLQYLPVFLLSQHQRLHQSNVLREDRWLRTMLVVGSRQRVGLDMLVN